MSEASRWILLVGGIAVFVSVALLASVRALGSWAAFMHEANNPRAEPQAKTSHYWYICFAAIVGWVILINPLDGDAPTAAVVGKVVLYAGIATLIHRWTRSHA